MIAVLDVVLALSVSALATAVVVARSPFASVVLFMSFGLVMSLAWLRLGAPDVALAEAALGAGVTGAMLLVATRRLETDPREEDE